jgi:hypothetical protein
MHDLTFSYASPDDKHIGVISGKVGDVKFSFKVIVLKSGNLFIAIPSIRVGEQWQPCFDFIDRGEKSAYLKTLHNFALQYFSQDSRGNWVPTRGS